MINQIDECFKSAGFRWAGVGRVDGVFVWPGADAVRSGVAVQMEVNTWALIK